MTAEKEKPACYGDLETVFPLGEDDLRHTPEACFACDLKTGCLRQAMAARDGLKVREEQVDRAYRSGMMGFWERWSRKKMIQNRLKETRQSQPKGKKRPC